MSKTQTLKGFRDFLPEEARKRAWLKSKITEVFELWGFEPLETPTLEPLEIFKGQVGEDEKLFYKFEDFGGREVALRYDQSVPASRVIGENSQILPMPFRRYQIQSAFRAEKPQKGRFREFLQCDADIFGETSPLADAEVIALALDIYRRIGFKNIRVLINDRELMKEIPYKAIVAIDKLPKIGEENVIKEMIEKGIEETLAEYYLDKVKGLKPNETVKIIFDYLDNLGFDKSWYKFEPTLARSFSYSSGPIWEITIPDYKGGSVLGGERFDNLVKDVTGVDVPATGFAMGFDRTLEAAEELGLVPSISVSTKVLVTVFSEELLKQSANILKVLREKGVAAELYPSFNKKLDKQIKYADKKGIPNVMIIGPDEAKNNTATLKNLKDKTQETLSLNEACEKLSKTSE